MNLKSSFYGSSTILRLFAAAAIGSMVGGWIFFSLGWFGPWLFSQFATFVLGMASCCPLGGIATLCSVLTLASWLALAWMNSAS
jgi:hypothetical protein